MASAIPIIGAGASIAQGLGLFGGTKQKQQSQQQSQSFQQSTPIDMTRPEFLALGQTAAGGLQSEIGAGRTNFTPYSGPFTSTISPELTSALGGISTAAMDPARAAAINAFATGQNINPYVQQAVNAAVTPLQIAQNQELGRRIPGQFAAAGQQLGAEGSSPFQRALGESAYLSQRAIGDVASTVANQAFQQAQNAQLQGIALGQNDVQAMLQNVQAQYLPQAIQEQGIDRAIQAGQAGIQNQLQAFNVAQGFPLQPIANQSTGTSTSTGTATGTTSAAPNLAAGLFGNQGIIPYFRPPINTAAPA